MPAAIDKHVAFFPAPAGENVFAACVAVNTSESTCADKRALTTIGIAPARMAHAAAGQAVAPPVPAAIDKHVAVLTAGVREKVLTTCFAVNAREARLLARRG